MQGYGKQRTHKIFISPRNRKKCCHYQVFRKTNQLKSMQGFGMQSVARCCQKTNQLQSVQGYRKQRTHKNIYKSKKQKKSVAIATLVARCCRKTNPFQSVQGYGKQRTHKIFISPRNMAIPVASYRYKTNQLQSMQGLGMLKTPKKILKPKKHEKVLPRQHLLPDIAKKAITHELSCH